MANKLTSQYIWRISRRMPIGGSRKRQFLATLRESVIQHLEKNPDSDYAQLEAQFGTPDEIADDFIAQMSSQQINAKFRTRNRVVAIVAAVAIIIAMSWIGMVLEIIDEDDSMDRGYSTATPFETFYSEEK